MGERDDTIAPQLLFYAAVRDGRTALIHRPSGRVAGWIERVDEEHLRARRHDWIGPTVETIPSAIHKLARAWSDIEAAKRAAKSSS